MMQGFDAKSFFQRSLESVLNFFGCGRENSNSLLVIDETPSDKESVADIQAEDMESNLLQSAAENQCRTRRRSNRLNLNNAPENSKKKSKN